MAKQTSTRSSWAWLLLFAVVFALLGLSVLLFPEPPTLSVEEGVEQQDVGEFGRDRPIQPIRPPAGLDTEKVALGRRLFHETRFSADGAVACATCHDLARGGVDGLPRSRGIGGAEGEVNAPTVFNAVFNFKQFWDGRADNLTDQMEGPIHNPKELGSNWPDILKRLEPDYAAVFQRLYPQGLSVDNVKDAIVAFQQSLVTPDSSFDRYLRGDLDALTEKQRLGYSRFLTLGCIKCHQGVGVGGNMFQRMGAKNDYFRDRGSETQADLGRFNVTGEEFDRYRFKVPSLRNVALTAPYFHDGSAKTLEQAVSVMARYQLARELSDLEREQLVAFLGSLTGTYQGKPL